MNGRYNTPRVPPVDERLLNTRLRCGFEKPIAHRGLFEAGRLPENSLEAFAAAKEQGFAAECDVRLSRTGEVFVFHDDTLARLTGGGGAFDCMPEGEIAELRLQGTSSRIPTLRELLALAGSEMPLVIELKSFSHAGWDTSGRLERAVLEVLSTFQGVALLKSFNPHSVWVLLGESHSWPVGQIACTMGRDGDFVFLRDDEAKRLSRLETEAACGAHFISYGVSDLDERLRFGSTHGHKPWMAWTLRTPAQLERAAALRCQAIFERPVLSEVLARREAPGELAPCP